MALSRDQILAVPDLKIELVPVPEWGGEVYVKSMSGVERDKFESSIIERKGKNQIVKTDNIRAKLCAYTLCDAEGNLLFSEKDIIELGKKNASALSRVFMVARNLSGIGEEEMKELADDLQENFTGDSVSA